MRILHITEALGGGVTSAINTYVEHSSQFDHYLFATNRTDDMTGEEGMAIFKSTKIVRRRLISLYLLYKYMVDLRPDVIHVHSTYAGLIVRLMPFIDRKRVVYTPHAYAFLRNDNPIKLKLYYCIEYFLSFRTQIIAGCGKDERNISCEFKKHEHTAELVNVCGLLPDIEKTVVTDVPTIVMIGRVCDQKGYDYFAEVAIAVGKYARFLWIGGGDVIGVKRLKEAGVTVTGWLSRKKALQTLVNADMYFHTAAWDGFPISVLEASHFDIPLLLRGIGPFTAEGLSVVDSVKEASDMIKKYIHGDKNVVEELFANSKSVRQYHSSANLAAALDDLYNGLGAK